MFIHKMYVIFSVQVPHQESYDPGNTVLKGSRMKKLCPVPNCQAVVVHLPRHLRTVHKWKADRVRVALQVFNLRKRYQHSTNPQKSKKTTDHRHSRQCPVDKCGAVVRQLSSHLTNYHRLRKASTMYQTMLTVAKKRSRKQQKKSDEFNSSCSSSVMGDDDEVAEDYVESPLCCDGVEDDISPTIDNEIIPNVEVETTEQMDATKQRVIMFH